MRPGWVAGAARARGLARRRLGRDAAGELARLDSLPAALERLGASSYRRLVKSGMDLPTAQRALGNSALWHLRVLAGWLRPDGVGLLRVVAGWYEIANIEDRLADTGAPPFELGALALAPPRVTPANGLARQRLPLTDGSWGDPGSAPSGTAGVALRMTWAARLAATAPVAAAWGAGLAALLAAQLLVSDRADTLAPRVGGEAARLLGPRWAEARSVEELAAGLSRPARWVFTTAQDRQDLWMSQIRWWDRVEEEGLAVRSTGSGPDAVVGVGMALVADAWRVGAALEVAARGGAEELARVLA